MQFLVVVSFFFSSLEVFTTFGYCVTSSGPPIPPIGTFVTWGIILR